MGGEEREDERNKGREGETDRYGERVFVCLRGEIERQIRRNGRICVCVCVCVWRGERNNISCTICIYFSVDDDF